MESAIALATSLIAAIGGIVAAYVSTKNRQDAERAERKTIEYRDKRERIDKAKWQVLLSTMEGVTVLLHHAKGEKLNGNVEAALEDIESARDNLTKVQIETLVKD